ncbi:MAG: AzlD domain-containing protein [Archaeoglobaceae archaeon]
MDQISQVALIIVGMALVTYLPRLIPMLNPMEFDLKFLKYVPVSLFAALVFPELLLNQDQVLTVDAETFAGGIALLAAWRTKNIIFTMIAGLLVLYLLKNLVF